MQAPLPIAAQDDAAQAAPDFERRSVPRPVGVRSASLAVLAVLATARREACIYMRELEADIYDHAEVIDHPGQRRGGVGHV